MSVWVQKLSELRAYEKCLIMCLAIDLNWGHLVGVLEGNHSSIRSYFSEIDWDTRPDFFWGQLSFDSGYMFRDQKLFPKKTPKVRLYPSLTSTLSSILRPCWTNSDAPGYAGDHLVKLQGSKQMYCNSCNW